jgi:hypothetical protein
MNDRAHEGAMMQKRVQTPDASPPLGAGANDPRLRWWQAMSNLSEIHD